MADTSGSATISSIMSNEPPAENALPAPWTTTTRTLSSRSITGQTSAGCRGSARPTALRFGPSRTMRRTPSCVVGHGPNVAPGGSLLIQP
jgi:hypothetical protein